jgi:hypothetical protein
MSCKLGSSRSPEPNILNLITGAQEGAEATSRSRCNDARTPCKLWGVCYKLTCITIIPATVIKIAKLVTLDEGPGGCT